MKNKLGLFCNENSIRFLPDVVLKKDHLDSILQKYSDKPTIGIVELVINASLYKVTLVNENVQVFIILDGVQGWGTDNNYNFIITDDQYKLAYKYILSKKLAEFNVLSREVGIKFVGKDKSNNLIAQIFQSRNDYYKLYTELISAGAAKLTKFIGSFPSSDLQLLEYRQLEAQDDKSMIWKGLETSIDESFNGVVVEAVSGDTINVYNDETRKVIKLNLAGIKAPNIGNIDVQPDDYA